MRVQTRVVLAMSVLGLCYAALLGGVAGYQQRATHRLASAREAEACTSVLRIADLDCAPARSLAEDYSRWDEMVAFVDGRGADRVWAEEEIPTALRTFGCDAVWILDLEGNLVWSCGAEALGERPESPVSPSEARECFGRRTPVAAWAVVDTVPLEVFGAGIVPSTDDARATPAHGYVLAARVWDARRLSRVGRLVGGDVRVATEGSDLLDAASSTGDDGSVLVREPLRGPLGAMVGERLFRVPSEEVHRALATTRWLAALGVLAALAVVAVAWQVLAHSVTKPLHRISRSLAEQNPSAIRSLVADPDEFGEIARLMDQSFAHSEALSREVDERRRAEEALALSRAHITAEAALSEVFLTASDEELAEAVASVLRAAFASRWSLCGFIDVDGALVCDAGSDLPRPLPAPFGPRPIPEGAWRGPWAEALLEGRIVRAHESPEVWEGAPQPANALAIPVIHRRTPLGLALILEREGGFGEEQMALAERLRQHVAPILAARLAQRDAEKHRRDIQEELEQQREQLQVLIGSLPMGLLLIDPDTHTIVDANASACEMIGAPAEVLAGQVCHRYICPADVGQCPVTDLGLPVDRSERVIVRADGGYVPIVKSVVPIVSGDRTFLLETFVDVTELKRTQDALAASETEALTLARRLEAENGRMRRELETAAAVQTRTLPEHCRAEGLDIAHEFRPSDRIGGDFFGAIQGERASMIYVGDVSGHGLASALVVNLVVGIMEEVVDPDSMAPGRALEVLQTRVSARLEAMGHYTTLLLCRHATGSRTVQYANAGHPWPLHLAQEGCEEVAGEPGLPLGWFTDAEYLTGSVELSDGDALLLYSDGLTEAAVADQPERLGTGPVCACLQPMHGAAAEDLVGAVTAEADRASAGAPLEDDLTVLALRLRD